MADITFPRHGVGLAGGGRDGRGLGARQRDQARPPSGHRGWPVAEPTAVTSAGHTEGSEMEAYLSSRVEGWDPRTNVKTNCALVTAGDLLQNGARLGDTPGSKRGRVPKRKRRPRGWPGAARELGRVRTVRPANRGRSRTEPSGSQSTAGGRRRAVPLAARAARVDRLHVVPVNAPVTGVLNRRKPLSGMRLRPGFACRRWCVNAPAWVAIQTV